MALTNLDVRAGSRHQAWIAIETSRHEKIEVKGFDLDCERDSGKARLHILRPAQLIARGLAAHHRDDGCGLDMAVLNAGKQRGCGHCEGCDNTRLKTVFCSFLYSVGAALTPFD